MGDKHLEQITKQALEKFDKPI